MKKPFFLTVAFFFCSWTLKSQITKGNWLVGGSLSYSNSQSSGDDATSNKTRITGISTNSGYFLKNRFAAGLMLNFLFTKVKYPQPDGTSSVIIQDKYGVGPFARYYFLNEERNVNILTEGSVFYSILKNKSTGGTESKFKDFEYNLFAGPVIFLNSSVGLEFLLGYSGSKAVDFDARGKSIRFKIGFQIHLEKE